MDVSQSVEETEAPFGPDSSSRAALLEYGLRCLQQRHSAEKIVRLAVGDARVAPGQTHLIDAIKACGQSYAKYVSAQQALQEASKQLTEVYIELQANLNLLEQLLPDLLEDVDGNSLAVPQWLKTLLNHQEPQSSQTAPRSSEDHQVPLTVQPAAENHTALPELYFTCFGHFEVKRLGQPLPPCANRNGQLVLRYLVAQPRYRAMADRLTEVLWPEGEPRAGRHRLQVAISALRRSLNTGYSCDPGGGYILFKDPVYQLNPAVQFRSDVDAFLELYQVGQSIGGSEAIAHYEQACRLYTGPFLIEDMYADWSFTRREQLSHIYQKMCSVLAEHYLKAEHYEEVVKWASAILEENNCDEDAHRQLIRAYAEQGRRSDALRQCRRCEQQLLEELGMQPMPETTQLCRTLLLCEEESEKVVKIERK